MLYIIFLSHVKGIKIDLEDDICTNLEQNK